MLVLIKTKIMKRTLDSYLTECMNIVQKKPNVWKYELTPNNIVDVYYSVIPKQEGDYDTPSFAESVEVDSMKLNGDCVTELLEHMIEEIELEISKDLEYDRNCPL